MAVIQISKIQVRRGAIGDEGMPQLASGELGWAVDTQQLFIGNGSIAEGAPAIGNTEILTISSTATTNIFERFLSEDIYSYKGVNEGTTLLGTSVRTVQRKLDETVTVLDFGAVDREDITVSLQQAIDQLYTNSDNIYESSRRILRLPAGKYYTTSVVFVPPYATIIGDGQEKTVIETSGSTIFQSTSSGAVGARNIVFEGMTLMHSTSTAIASTAPLLKINNASDTSINGVTFRGHYIAAGTNSISNSGIKLEGVETINTYIENCTFVDLSYGIYGDDDADFTNIDNNLFTFLYKGIALGTNALGSGNSVYGPRRTKISNNNFKRIEKQAVVLGKSTRNNIYTTLQSDGNYFFDVGSDLTYDVVQSTAILELYGQNNQSVNDKFGRFTNAAFGPSNRKFLPLVKGTCALTLNGEFSRTISTGTSTMLLMRIPYDNKSTNLVLDYVLDKTGKTRNGHLVVGAGSNGVTSKDSYSYVGSDDGGVTMSAELVDSESLGSTDSLSVKYTNTVNTGTIKFTLSYQQ